MIGQVWSPDEPVDHTKYSHHGRGLVMHWPSCGVCLNTAGAGKSSCDFNTGSWKRTTFESFLCVSPSVCLSVCLSDVIPQKRFVGISSNTSVSGIVQGWSLSFQNVYPLCYNSHIRHNWTDIIFLFFNMAQFAGVMMSAPLLVYICSYYPLLAGHYYTAWSNAYGTENQSTNTRKL